MTKAKYEVYGNNHLAYFFTTTTRNVEDCINLMLEKFSLTYENLKIFQIMEGEKKLVYTNMVYRKPRRVEDIETGEVFENAWDYSKKKGVKFVTVRRHLGKISRPLKPMCTYYKEQKTA